MYSTDILAFTRAFCSRDYGIVNRDAYDDFCVMSVVEVFVHCPYSRHLHLQNRFLAFLKKNIVFKIWARSDGRSLRRRTT